METNPTINFLLQAILFAIMLGIGLTLKLSDIHGIIKTPKAVIAGVFMQITILPLAGILVVHLFSLPASIKLGILVLVACPGGVSSNLISFIFKGDTALSVTLSIFSSLLQIITLPLIIGIANEHFGQSGSVYSTQIKPGGIIKNLLLLTALPTVLGMAIRRWKELLAIRLIPIFKLISLLVLVASLIFVFISNSKQILSYFFEIGIATTSMTLFLLFGSYWAGRFLKLSRRQRKTLAIETSVLNNILGIIICTTILHDANAAIPGFVYGPTMILSAILFMWLLPKDDEPENQLQRGLSSKRKINSRYFLR